MNTLIGLAISLCGWGMGVFFAGVSLYAMAGAIIRMDIKLFLGGLICLLTGFVIWWVLVTLASTYGIPKPRLSRRRKNR